MKNSLEIIIPGKPIAKKRPRFARRGKFMAAINDQETEEGRFLLQAQQQIHQRPFEGPIQVYMTFSMSIPKSTSKKRALLMEQGKIDHIKRPDLDNLEKFASDCLSGDAWRDDSQIVMSTTQKKYSRDPGTKITIIALEKQGGLNDRGIFKG